MKIILEADDFTKQPLDIETVPAIIGWDHVEERLEVNVNGIDVWDLLMPATQFGLEDSFKSDFEPVINRGYHGDLKVFSGAGLTLEQARNADNNAFDDIDVPTYRELNEI